MLRFMRCSYQRGDGAVVSATNILPTSFSVNHFLAPACIVVMFPYIIYNYFCIFKCESMISNNTINRKHLAETACTIWKVKLLGIHGTQGMSWTFKTLMTHL